MQKNPKRLAQFICISGASLMYYVPFMIGSYYDAMMEALQVNNMQMGVLSSVYSTVCLITYLPGGLIADKFPVRKLLGISYAGTGLMSLWYATFPTYSIAVALLAGMGVTSTLTFWSAMLKAARMYIAEGDGNEGKGMSMVEGARGVISTVVAYIALFVFSRFTDQVVGARYVILIFAFVNIALGVIAWILLGDGKTDQGEQSGMMKNIFLSIKNPNVWLMSLIVVCFYITNTCLKYVTPYSTGIFGLSAVLGTVIATFKECGRPVGAFISAAFSKKWKVKRVLTVMGAFVVTFDLMIAVIPQNPAFAFVVFIGGAMGYVAIGAVRGVYYATMKDADIPIELTGTTTGIMSTVGFLPDAIVPIVVGTCLDSIGPEITYPAVFYICAGCAVLGIIVTGIFYRKNMDSEK